MNCDLNVQQVLQLNQVKDDECLIRSFMYACSCILQMKKRNYCCLHKLIPRPHAALNLKVTMNDHIRAQQPTTMNQKLQKQHNQSNYHNPHFTSVEKPFHFLLDHIYELRVISGD